MRTLNYPNITDAQTLLSQFQTQFHWKTPVYSFTKHRKLTLQNARLPSWLAWDRLKTPCGSDCAWLRNDARLCATDGTFKFTIRIRNPLAKWKCISNRCRGSIPSLSVLHRNYGESFEVVAPLRWRIFHLFLDKCRQRIQSALT